MTQKTGKPAKELLFSVTAADCRWDYYRATGAGGQHRNKTDSACRCTHLPSGAVGKAENDRSQHVNKRRAFGKMARTPEFQKWARIEGLRRMGRLKEIEAAIDMEMRRNIAVDVRVDGKWVPESEAIKEKPNEDRTHAGQ